MTTFQIPSGAGSRLPDVVRDGPLALLGVLLVIVLLGVAIAVSTVGALAPAVPTGSGMLPSARAQAAPLPPVAHR